MRSYSVSRTQDEKPLIAVQKTLPILSIHGVEDRHMWVDKMETFMRSNFELVEFHRIAGAGHAPFNEQPVPVDKIILGFIHKKISET